MNRELPDVQAGFRKGRGTRDQIANIQGIIKKASESESEVTQSCPTLSDPMDCSLLGSSIHGIFQARVLEWGAIAFSGMSAQLCAILGTPCIAVPQAPLFMGFPRQECWSGVPLPSPSDLLDPGIETASPLLDSLPLNHK